MVCEDSVGILVASTDGSDAGPWNRTTASFPCELGAPKIKLPNDCACDRACLLGFFFCKQPPVCVMSRNMKHTRQPRRDMARHGDNKREDARHDGPNALADSQQRPRRLLRRPPARASCGACVASSRLRKQTLSHRLVARGQLQRVRCGSPAGFGSAPPPLAPAPAGCGARAAWRRALAHRTH